METKYNDISYLLSPGNELQQKEAIKIIQRYGKKSAEICDEIIFGYRNDIHNLSFYDSKEIDELQKQIYFWEEVKILCLNWEQLY